MTGTGTPPANAPAVTYNKMAFDQTTDQTCMWTFRLPSDYLSGGSIFVKWYADVIAGAVIWKAGVAAVVDNTTNLLSAAAFNAADVSATVTVPGTSGLILETSWTLTATSVAASRLVQVFAGRYASAVGDTAAGNANIVAVEWEHSA